MEPKVDVFSAACLSLKATGIVHQKKGFKRLIFMLVEAFMLAFCFFFIIVMLVGVLQPGVALENRLENLSKFLAGIPSVYTFFVFAFSKDRVFKFIENVNSLIAEVEEEFGTGVTKEWRKHSNFILVAHSAVMLSSGIPAHAMAFYNYHFLGVKDAAPSKMFCPFDRNISVYANSAFQFSVMIGPILTLLMGKTVFGTIAIVTSGIIKKTRCQFEKVSASNHRELLKQAISWHSRITLIVSDSNSLLGTAFVMEYVAATCYLCTGSYLLAKCDATNIGLYVKQLLLIAALSVLSVFSCACGQVISMENEKLYDAIYQNSWYEMPFKERKNLLAPIIVARRDLEWHYKRLVVFNMATYQAIIRQSYSFFALIKAVDVEK